MKVSEQTKIGRLLSHFIKQIAQEKIYQESEGQELLITKAEALCRIIWRDAIGWTETLAGGERIVHKPDKNMIQLIYERIEGKVGTAEEHKRKDTSIPDKVSEVAKSRINKMVDSEKETTTI